MNLRERIAEQTAIRRALLKNGYTPLANRDKRCFLKGRNEITIDEARIDDWAAESRWQATGIRLTECDLLAIDIDIKDEDALNAVADALCDAIPALVGAPIRYGSSIKELWLVRTDEPIARAHSPQYAPPGTDMSMDPEDLKPLLQRVECWGGASGHQIAVYGAHTLEDGETEPSLYYEWSNDVGPADVSASHLPMLTRAEAMRIPQIVADTLEGMGWNRRYRMSASDHDGEVVYDLTPEHVLHLKKGGDTPYPAVSAPGNCRMREIVGEGSNPNRGVIYETDDGHVYVWDSMTGTSHMPADAEPADPSENIQALGDRLQEIMGSQQFREEVDKLQDSGDRDFFEMLTETFVVFPNGAPAERIRAIEDQHLFYSKDGFKDLYPRTVEVDTGEVYERAGTKRGVPYVAGDPKLERVPLVNFWIKAESTIRIHGLKYLPGVNEVLTEHHGKTVLNTYRAPVYGDPRDEFNAIYDALLDHLFDKEDERAYFENWLAYKVQNLRSRGTFTLLVSPGVEGSGRGSLFEIISGVFGKRNCRLGISSDKIASRNGQAQYEDWMLDCVFGTVNELSTSGSLHGGRARTNLLDALKARFEVVPGEISVDQKYMQRRTDTCYLTTLAATNSPSALALDNMSDNRRFAVYQTGGRGPLSRDVKLFENMNKVRADGWVHPDMSATLADRYSVDRWGAAVSRDFIEAPTTEVKSHMTELNEGRTLPILRSVLNALDKDYVTAADLFSAVEDRVSSKYGGGETRFVHNDVGEAMGSAQGFMGWIRVPGRMKLADDRKPTVYARSVEHSERYRSMSRGEREAAL